MDDELQRLETELRELRPAAPAPRVADAIAEALGADMLHPEMGTRCAHGVNSPAAVRTRRLQVKHLTWWVGLGALPVAALVAIAVISSSRQRSHSVVAAGPDETLKPVRAKDVLFSAADEGLVTLADGVPARKQRLEYVGTITWRDPKTNASLTWSVPREEVRYVPVRFQ